MIGMACPHQRVFKTSTHSGLASLPAWLPHSLVFLLYSSLFTCIVKFLSWEQGCYYSVSTALAAQAWRRDLSSDPPALT